MYNILYLYIYQVLTNSFLMVQTPIFICGINLKSKIQNLKLFDLLARGVKLNPTRAFI